MYWTPIISKIVNYRYCFINKGITHMGTYLADNYRLDLTKVPEFVTAEIPGPKSVAMHDRCTKHFKGLS